MKDIYDKLIKKYGPQKWWPVTSRGLVPSYTGGPRNDKDRFEVMIGAILTQNTSWKNVEKAIINLNEASVLSVNGILKADDGKLKELIRPAGYFNQKAERLKMIAEFVKMDSISKLMDMDVSELRMLLLSLKGIGPETADSILLYALEKPIFVIDAYTKRIFSRLGYLAEHASYDEWQSLFHSKLKKDVKIFQEYHALIVEHAKQFCNKKPKCDVCFLR